jgi:hypothetical protein
MTNGRGKSDSCTVPAKSPNKAEGPAAGVDGETWERYGENLEENLADLSGRLERRAYRAKPARRVFIPKADGRQRPLAIPALEDKIVQRAAVAVLSAIYEHDFLGFSYGFRPGRSQHRALDALSVGIHTRRVNWVLDADIVRYADDFIVGFERKEEAERFLAELKDRLASFGLELHPDKTRLIPFGRKAAKDWRDGDGPKPGTFDFLGFTHSCGKTRSGKFSVLRQTSRKRLRKKLAEVKSELRRRLHEPVSVVGEWLRRVVQGHVNYYGVPMNGWAICIFRSAVKWLWCRALRRRSQKHRTTWERMDRLALKWLPPARICHPWPFQRLGVMTQGKSPVR